MSSSRLRFAELTNGRLAMLGVSLIAIGETMTGNGLMTHLQDLSTNSIWWKIGIYAVSQ